MASLLGSPWLQTLAPAFNPNQGAVNGTYNRREQFGRIAIVILLITVLLGPFLTFADIGHENEGNIERQIAYFVALGLTVFASLPVATRFSMIAITWPVGLALGWAWLSLTWAIDPGMGFRRLFLATIVVWMCFALVRHIGYRAVTDMLRLVLVGTVISCLFVSYFFPVVGTHTMLETAIPTAITGNWRGWLGHKNFAGAAAAVCILLFMFDAKRFGWPLRIAVFVIVGFFLYKTQSKTSAGMLVLAMGGGYVFEKMSNRFRAFFIPFAMIVVCLIWFWTSYYNDVIMGNVLNPTSFTGRGQIWRMLLHYIDDHLWLGAGYGSFWNIGALSPVYQYGQGFVREITIGHSGFIDQTAAVGLPGMLLMVFSLMIWPLWTLLVRSSVPADRGALCATLVMFCIGHNVTESSLYERDGIVAVFLYIAAALCQYCTISDGYLQRTSVADLSLIKAMRERRAAAATTANS